MNEIDSKWIKKIIKALILGFIIGRALSFITGLILTDPIFELFISLIVPCVIIIGLIIVLIQYQKEKDDTLGDGRK